jgi:hypothetical protein
MDVQPEPIQMEFAQDPASHMEVCQPPAGGIAQPKSDEMEVIEDLDDSDYQPHRPRYRTKQTAKKCTGEECAHMTLNTSVAPTMSMALTPMVQTVPPPIPLMENRGMNDDVRAYTNCSYPHI